MKEISRRELLAAVSLGGAAPVGAQAPVAADREQGSFAPTLITPAESFFVRDHFAEPDLSLASWRLRIEGKVARPVELTFSDLVELPSQRLESTLECAGNGETGYAVSTGDWEGVPLAELLREAGAPKSGQLLLEGADEGELLKGSPRARYTRIVSIEKCIGPECLAAYKLNGRFLPRRNGFPVRAILGGWYGMDSVKWLQRIAVLDKDERPEAFYGTAMHQLYSRVFSRDGAPPKLERISQALVKSEIAFPTKAARLPAGTHSVWGYAWAGERAIRSVRVSADRGKSWASATLEGKPRPLTWVKWRYAWNAQPGEWTLLSRAEDAAGNLQPLSRDSKRQDSYELNWCAAVECTIF